MELHDAIRLRQSVRKFKDQPLDDKVLTQILDSARYAPSSCNEQLWNLIVIKNQRIKEQIVRIAGTSTLITKAPVVIAIYYYDRAERPANIETASAAIQNMALTATDLGVGSLWLGAVGHRGRVGKILGVPKEHYLVAFLLLGYAESYEILRHALRPLDEIVHFERFRNSRKIRSTHNPEKWTMNEVAEHQRFICRKTSLGTKLMVVHVEEIRRLRQIVSNHLGQNTLDPVLDLFSYDGSLLTVFPSNRYVVSAELSDQSAHYIRKKNRNSLVFDGSSLPIREKSLSLVTMMYKAESLPTSILKHLISEVSRVLKPGGAFIIAFNTQFSLYGLFYFSLKLMYRDNIRRSAIYCYFGPYKPLQLGCLKRILRNIGLKVTVEHGWLIPPILEEYLALFYQYLLSGGTSFLRRRRIKDGLLFKILRVAIRWTKNVPMFSSPVYLRARNSECPTVN